MANQHEQPGLSAVERTKKYVVPFMAAAALVGAAKAGASVNAERGHQTPALAHGERSNWEPVWEKAAKQIIRRPELLNIALVFNQPKPVYGHPNSYYPFYRDPWKKTTRISLVTPPHTKEVIYYPLYGRFDGKDWLMFRQRNRDGDGNDIPTPLESGSENFWIPVSEVKSTLHATIYKGYLPGNIVKPQLYYEPYQNADNVYPGHYVRSPNRVPDTIIATMWTDQPPNVAQEFGLQKLPDQNLEHFIH